jgi:hypothetical protein
MALLNLDVESVADAAYEGRTAGRKISENGCRERPWHTRATESDPERAQSCLKQHVGEPAPIAGASVSRLGRNRCPKLLDGFWC